MGRIPELIIAYDENHFPTDAACSACGERMPNVGKLFPTSAENIQWFVAQFNSHVNQKHNEKDVPLR